MTVILLKNKSFCSSSTISTYVILIVFIYLIDSKINKTTAQDVTTPAPGTISPAPETITPAPGTLTSSPGTIASSPGTITPAPGTITSSSETITSTPGTTITPSNPCTGCLGRIADKNDLTCQRYFYCVYDGTNFSYWTLKCPNTLVFRPTSKTCVSRRIYTCGSAVEMKC